MSWGTPWAGNEDMTVMRVMSEMDQKGHGLEFDGNIFEIRTKKQNDIVGNLCLYSIIEVCQTMELVSPLNAKRKQNGIVKSRCLYFFV